VAVLAAIAGELAGATAAAVGSAIVSWFLPRSACRVGQDVRVSYVIPRHRVVPLAGVRGVTSEKGIWMTRLEVATGNPIVFPGQLQGKLERLISATRS
jgi:hypothetical protein